MAIIYTKGDTVQYGGSTYVATRDILDTDPAPGNGVMWSLLSAAGPAYRSLTHGGIKKPTWRDSTWTDVSWTKQFMVMGFSEGFALPLDRYFNIYSPPSGTTIHQTDGGSRLSNANGIPLQAWESVYYELPVLDGSGGGTDYNKYWITSPYFTNIAIPAHWVHIVTRNHDNAPYDTYHWGDGQVTQHFWSMNLLNGWAPYGAGYADPKYRLDNGRVQCQGLITAGVGDIAILPPGFRPTQRLMFATLANGGLGRVDVFPTGYLSLIQGANNFVNLDSITFPVEQ